MTFWSWSRTAAANASADTTINWAEGQAPSSVNDSARAVMAAAAKYRDDIAGAIATGGTSTAYTVTSYEVFDTLAHMNGQMIAFTPHATNGATVTLNVDGLGAKALRSSPGVELLAGTLILGTPYIATYNNSDAAWYLHGFYSNPYSVPLLAALDYWDSVTPNSAFVFPIGQAISRTVYSAVFARLGTIWGVGNGSTTFNIPDLRGRFPSVADNMGGVAVGLSNISYTQSGGAATATLAAANLPAHTHSGTTGNDSPDHTHPYTSPASGNGTGTTPNYFNSSAAAANTGGASTRHQHPFTTDGGPGTSTAFSILPPTLGCNYIIRVL